MESEDPESRSVTAPLLVWTAKHSDALVAGLPWCVGGLLALALAGSGGPGAFGLALGIEGIALAIWAGFITLMATADARELRGLVTEAQVALASLHHSVAATQTTASEVSAAVGSTKDLLVRITARDDLDRLSKISGAVSPLVMRTFTPPALADTPSGAPVPTTLSGVQREELGKGLWEAMKNAHGLALPNCNRLQYELGPGPGLKRIFDPTLPDPVMTDFRPLVEAAARELDQQISACKRQLAGT